MENIIFYILSCILLKQSSSRIGQKDLDHLATLEYMHFTIQTTTYNIILYKFSLIIKGSPRSIIRRRFLIIWKNYYDMENVYSTQKKASIIEVCKLSSCNMKARLKHLSRKDSLLRHYPQRYKKFIQNEFIQIYEKEEICIYLENEALHQEASSRFQESFVERFG